MSFVTDHEIYDIKSKLCSDVATLGKLYKARKSEYYVKSVDHSLVEDLVKDGWEEFTSQLKTKTKLRKLKSHDKIFEDQIWCQLYELGYRTLNYDNTLKLPYGKDAGDNKQIDVFALSDESILIVECKSSEKQKNYSFKTDFEALPNILGGFRKCIEQAFGRGIRVKYIFATRNFRIDSDGPDIERLLKTKSFYYNDNSFHYINNLIEKYKGAALYQFQGILFKGEQIKKERIEVPAIEGKMGGKTYYMFSIEPHLLLKMGFILHRTEANESETPTYQRLLVPARLKGITTYIDKGGYFPNSVIVNFNQKGHHLQFESMARGEDTNARAGTLKIPNAFAIAYIIDGQHRLYGYANSSRKNSNTIPVVAFVDLDPFEQLKIFMDINENQKAVSASLRLTLEEDLYWDSERADSRLKALRSSIIRVLATTQGPFYKQIQIGEDRALLSARPFAEAIVKSGLIPRAKGNQFVIESTTSCLYDTNNHDHLKEMRKSQKSIVKFISLCFEYVEASYPDIFNRKNYLIFSNRGVFAFISVIGSLNHYETTLNSISLKSSAEDRFKTIQKHLDILLKQIQAMDKTEEDKLLLMQGSQVETKWLMHFQSMINQKNPRFITDELKDWLERQDEDLQDKGRKLGESIERHVKKTILTKLRTIFSENWDLEIGEIKTQCEARANEEIQRRYKEGLGRSKIEWTEMFFITDYKWIIEKHWTKTPDPCPAGFVTFEKEFSLNIGLGFNSKSEKLKWISVFNSHRNLWAHAGTKETRLNREEVGFLEKVHNTLLTHNR